MAESGKSDSAAGEQPGTAPSLANRANEQVTNVLQLLRSATPSTFARSRVVTRNTKKNSQRKEDQERRVLRPLPQ